MLAIACSGLAQPAVANDFSVYSPHVVQGQKEIELRGFHYRDGGSALNRTGANEMSVAYGVNRWWKTELYAGRFAYGQDGVRHPVGYEFENIFQLADPGEYWADPGFVLSYVHNRQAGTPSSIEFGPLFEKWSGHVIQRLNTIWEKQVGSQASGKYAFRSAYSFGYKIRPTLVPGFEAYYRPVDNASQIGPALSGELQTAQGSELGYSVAVLYGLNKMAPKQTLIFRLEYGFF
ncbi:MAG: hypothetical protein GC139_06890 [Sideroxydans sp.]|nr:hypothetical protein [Sideroxydans sp.]